MRNKTTFFSQTFKVEEKKVVFFFIKDKLSEIWPFFSFSRFGFEKLKIIENENGHISLNLAQNKKVRPLSFLQY